MLKNDLLEDLLVDAFSVRNSFYKDLRYTDVINEVMNIYVLHGNKKYSCWGDQKLYKSMKDDLDNYFLYRAKDEMSSNQ